MNRTHAHRAREALAPELLSLKAQIRARRASRRKAYPPCAAWDLADCTADTLRTLVRMPREDLNGRFGQGIGGRSRQSEKTHRRAMA